MARRRSLTLPLIPDDEFNVFWSAYPRRVAKLDALRAWADLKPSPELLAHIVGALSWQKQTHDWRKDGGRFIPYPASYLRGGRWLDQPVKAADLQVERPDWQAECQAKHGGRCHSQYQHWLFSGE